MAQLFRSHWPDGAASDTTRNHGMSPRKSLAFINWPKRNKSDVVLLLFFSSIISTVAAANVLDFSYQSQLNTKSVLTALLKRRASLKSDQVLQIDLSSSNLGDNGLREILSSVLSEDEATSSGLCFDLDLKAQLNRLTAVGVTACLNSLLPPNDTKVDSKTRSRLAILRSLDLGWNKLCKEGATTTDNKAFHKALQQLIASNSSHSLQILTLSCTGLGPTTCRALAKGLLERFETNIYSNITKRTPLLSLYLSCNPEMGDAGAAALAAGIRNIAYNNNQGIQVLDTLDLSACDISDVGAEALALALEDASISIIRRLVLSHNRISDQGALSLGRALQQLQKASNGHEVHLDLSDNPRITDRGIATLLAAVEKGALTDLTLRSCSIHADGAELVGKALRTFATTAHKASSNKCVTIDLSGNPLGSLRGKSKQEAGGGKYSASLLKSKASATASAYVTQGLSFLKKGLGPGFSNLAESDDDEEEKQHGASFSDRLSEGKGDKQNDNKRCGFKAMANAFIGNDHRPTDHSDIVGALPENNRIHLGLRRTFCDTAGADALAAMLVAVIDDLQGVKLELELDLNPVVEDVMVAALHGDNNDLLHEMAERHTEAMEIINKAPKRAVEAARLVELRRQDAADYSFEDYRNDASGAAPYDNSDWDSDADYEDDEY